MTAPRGNGRIASPAAQTMPAPFETFAVMSRKAHLQRLHRKGARPFFEAHASLVVFFGLMPVALFAWDAGWWPITVACWIVQGHFGHSVLLAFHEASHYTLHPSRRLNEMLGIGIGTLILTPLSSYRWVHNQHHLHLGTAHDTEMWPFVVPGTPRWKRVVSAAGELLLGFFYTPIVFLRGVLVANLPRHTARRLFAEYALSAGFWTVTLVAIAYFGVWPYFLLGYLVPSMISGNLQSLRKFTEHMGLLGHDVPSTTRTVIDESLPGRVLSATMLHIDYHGPHHEYSKIPHFNLPEATPVVYEQELKEPAAANVFRSYPAAVWDMVRTLGDPKVGAQWITTVAPAPQRVAA